MSEKKEKGVIKELTDFYNSSKNFIVNCEKPDRKGIYYLKKFNFRTILFNIFFLFSFSNLNF